MSNDRFGKWWPCLRKHYKRLNIWLPQARRLHEGLNGERSLRYFTLCARPMIDVYMMVKEKMLPWNRKTKRIEGVSFCELDEKIFPEMKELIGVEEAGFLAKLEDLVLFQDTSETETLDTETSLTAYLEEHGEGLDSAIRQKVEDKRKHLQFQNLFPFDFLNLDFCDRYYEDPPNVMKIHSTVARMLDWQQRPGALSDGKSFSVNKFVVAITCRVDTDTPSDAMSRLKRIVASNRDEHTTYKEALKTRSTLDIEAWANTDLLDFFMSAWPKELARLAKEKSWDIAVHDHAFYDRQGDSGRRYHMVCLVVEFTRTNLCSTYLSAVTRCLDLSSRKSIPRFEPEGDGVPLVENLRGVIALRNEQAKGFARDTLPDPVAEISRLRAEGIPI